MRTGVSILFTILMTFTGAHLTIATHFCCGEIAATKVSLSGKLATCGMEGDEGSCPAGGSNVKTHCCDNSMVTIGIINNFDPPCTIQNETYRHITHAFFMPVDQNFTNTPYPKIIFTDTGPPGRFPASAVDLDFVCTFRI
jgi:hypothetical protein